MAARSEGEGQCRELREIPPEPFRLYSIASPPPGQPASTLRLVVTVVVPAGT
ncbi:hypothetical protein [Acrocarpospora sp. B8E8]|uniref:hypothetical protein n=1 Tax=Acrocarpospora sp. B8E8 TaxID=3153572 RepID=UPI00325F9957